METDAQAAVTKCIAVIWLLTGLAAAFLVVRVYCKICNNKSRGLWIDDGVLFAAWLLLVTETALRTATLIAQVQIGQEPPSLAVIIKLGQLNAAAGPLSIAASMISKTSFIFTLLRFVTGRLRWFLWFAMVSMNLVTLLLILLILLRCRPITLGWDPTVQGECWPVSTLLAVGIFAGAYSAAMDIILSLLPWKLLWKLQMSTREKLGVCIAMSMGTFAGVTGIIKCVFIARFDSKNIFQAADLYIWENAEIAVTIIATTIPVLRVLIKRISTTRRDTALSNIPRSAVAPDRRVPTREHTDSASDKEILAHDLALVSPSIPAQSSSSDHEPRTSCDRYTLEKHSR